MVIADSNFSVKLSLANSQTVFRLSFCVKLRKQLIRVETMLLALDDGKTKLVQNEWWRINESH